KRDAFPGTAVEGRTIVRHNVFCKEENASTGGSARPNVLFGAFPATGWGAGDVYEVYGNFFYQNPVEALLQSTGNLALYANIFVNHFDPSGFRAIYITAQNGFQPRDVRIFHNTVWTANSSGGIRLYNPDNAYRQYCYANAVFAAQPITNFSDTLDNVSAAYPGAAMHLLSPTTDINTLSLYPQADRLLGTATPDVLFSSFPKAGKDFNGDSFDWRYRGAYSGCCDNPGWKLQLDTMTLSGQGTSGFSGFPSPSNMMEIYPNPSTADASVQYFLLHSEQVEFTLFDAMGRRIRTVFIGMQQQGRHMLHLDTRDLQPGMYYIRQLTGEGFTLRRIVRR
ncbi:MAG: T9SS type A sorting domain-containing protein, partial [Bacteroidota bacterium]